MKRIIPLVLCLPLALGARAEERPEGPDGPQAPSAERFMEGLERGLELDAMQKERIKPLVEESFAKSKAKRAEVEGLREKLRAAERELGEESRRLDEKVREQLTLEQKDRFDLMRLRRRGPMREERMERRFERRRFRRPGQQGGPGEGDDGDRMPGDMMPPPEMWEQPRQAPPPESDD